MSSLTYAIITPAHNEAAHLPAVIAAVAAQTHLPLHWLIINDRSTDATPEVLAQAESIYPFLKVLPISGPPGRSLGAHVVELFQAGLAHLPRRPDVIVKMDADVLLPPDYFARLLARFAADPQLGIASGKTYTRQQGQWVLERIADTHVTGACKAYRSACLADMGGLIPILGWDILDVAQARQRGWRTCSFRDLSLRHLRLTGSAGGMVRANLRYGACYYIIRAHPLFVLAKALYRTLERPYGLSLIMLAGYLMACLKQQPRLADASLAHYLRREQLDRLRGRTWQQEALLPHRLARAYPTEMDLKSP